jgi:hypothetical protein
MPKGLSDELSNRLRKARKNRPSLYTKMGFRTSQSGCQ